MTKLTIEAFSEMNRRRCESYNGFGESLQDDSKYTIAHWLLSVVSEVGESADAILGWEGLKERRKDKTKRDIAVELVDAITYIDLAIQKLGYQTADLLIEKFNEVNERSGFGKRFAL
jgi:NTP pyrophosphatase (non-canonical NTP hydrolase)